ncbi:hypothetical protein H4R20_006955, partial [Coemansia guatemalensis]
HGIMVLQASTMNEERYAEYRRSVDFINKHIFPGGHCPSVSALVGAATKGSRGMLMLESAANFPDHYARTLRVWRERFLHGFDKVLATAAPKNAQLILQERELTQQRRCRLRSCSSSTSSLTDIGSAPGKDGFAADDSAAFKEPTNSGAAVGYDDVFRRKWEYYFAYCEGAFATRTLGCTQLVFTRTYNEELSNKELQG